MPRCKSSLQKLAAYEHAPVERIRDASRAALAAMVDLAVQQRVDAVLIAGDLYDGNWTDHNTGLQFVRQAARLIDEGIPVLVIRGNHDAASVITTSLALPDNPDGSPIMIDAARTEAREVESAGLMVHARSFANRVEADNMAIDYGRPVGGLTNVGMLHTSLAGAEGHDTYSPTTAGYLTDKGYDYWALGHVHIRANHQTGDGPPIVFPGNLQGRHIRETGPKGCMIVDVDASHRCTPTFHPLGDVRWERLSIDGETIDRPDDVVDRVADWLDSEMGDARELLIVRVEVTGVSPIDGELRAARDGDTRRLAGPRGWGFRRSGLARRLQGSHPPAADAGRGGRGADAVGRGGDRSDAVGRGGGDSHRGGAGIAGQKIAPRIDR